MTDEIDDAVVEKALNEFWENCERGPTRGCFDAEFGNAKVAMSAAIRAAVLAERQACAEIARGWGVCVMGDNFDRAHVEEIANSVAPNVAAAILARGEK